MGNRGNRPRPKSSARVAARQERSAIIVRDLFTLWQVTLPRVSGKSKLAEALRYAISRREVFERFLTDGRIEIDSNIVERAIRPQATIRKNSLFTGSDGGGRTGSTIATLLQTAKMDTVDPRLGSPKRLSVSQTAGLAAISTPSYHGTTPPERPRLAGYSTPGVRGELPSIASERVSPISHWIENDETALECQSLRHR